MAADAGTAPTLDLYPTMRLQRLGSIAVVQPVWQGQVAGPSLTCDLETGTLALAEHPKVGWQAGPLAAPPGRPVQALGLQAAGGLPRSDRSALCI